MNSFPLPIRISAAAAAFAVPFSFSVSAFLALLAALGAILSVDYGRRDRRLTVPAQPNRSRAPFQTRACAGEPNCLAA